MRAPHAGIAIACVIGCAGESPFTSMAPDVVRQRVFEANDSIVTAMVDGRSTESWQTAEWAGVNLNGTRMRNEGFENEERTMQYDSIRVLEREARV